MESKKKQNEKKVIAAFDFDGTITQRDTLPYFIRFTVTLNRLFFGSLKMIPYLILFKLKVITNTKAKEELFKIFFAGIKLDYFNSLSLKFISKIDCMVNPEALERIKWHQNKGHEVVIISASVENWIKPWALQHDIQTVLATRLQLKDHLITGKFLTKNCHGKEKVDRLLHKYPKREDYILYAYGDSNGDKDLLASADHPFYRSFK